VAGDHELTATNLPPPSLAGGGRKRVLNHIRPYVLIALPLIFLLIFFVIPSVVLLSMSIVQSEDTIPTGNLTFDNFTTLLSNRLYLNAILRSVFVGIATGAIVVVLAYPLAYFLVRTASRWKNLLIALSLACAPTVGGLC